VRPDDVAARVSGVVLAAGSSRRMGRTKQLLRVGDRPMLVHVVAAALESELSELVVVLGAAAEEIRENLVPWTGERLRIVVNEAYAEGMSTSLRCGVAACDARSEAAAVLLGDQPGIEASLIDHMLRVFSGRRPSILRPVHRGSHGERVPGHPVLLARAVWPLLDHLEADEGARALMQQRPDLVQMVEVASCVPADVDTLEDYRRICAGTAAR
jgi:molybdenum cofactor cytidylyltransferase